MAKASKAGGAAAARGGAKGRSAATKRRGAAKGAPSPGAPRAGAPQPQPQPQPGGQQRPQQEQAAAQPQQAAARPQQAPAPAPAPGQPPLKAKKPRKPYTITKQREAWSDEEHQKFLEALRLYKREWKQIEAYVGTKTVIQIRSHAQKYFLKVQKLGTGEHVPPPRPKRKSSQPYPQAVKVPKAKAKATPRARGGAAGATGGKKKATAAGGAAVCRAGVGAGKQRNRGAGDSGSAALQTAQVHAATKAAAQAAVAQAAAQHQAAAQQAVARPDFASVYSLVSTLFGPCCSLGDTSSPDAQMPMPGAPAAGAAADSAGMLRNMTPIDRETALMLLSNLSSNLEKRAVHTQQLGKLTELGRQLAEPEGGGDLDARGGPYLTRFSDHEIVSMGAFPAVPVHLPLPGLQVPLVAVDGQTLPSAAAAV